MSGQAIQSCQHTRSPERAENNSNNGLVNQLERLVPPSRRVMYTIELNTVVRPNYIDAANEG